jgi:antitoxin component YwqK of YwqJK toxin-antitoxin module
MIMAFFFQWILSAGAQEITDNHINKSDTLGRKQGLWRVYDESGNLKYSGQYENGVPTGSFTYYYPEGKIKAVLNHLDSGNVVYAKNYFPAGHVMAEGKYIDQKKDSTWLYYSESDGSLSSEEHYNNTVKDGVWKTYYPEGQVAEEIIYRNGLKEGPWVQYFTDGKVKMKTTYINDEIEGQYLIYHLNGMVEVSGAYLNSKKNGTWVFYNEIGLMEKREEYKDGLLLDQEILIEKK